MRFVLVIGLIILLSACSNSRYSMKHDKGPVGEFDVSQVPDAVPKWEPLSPKGNQSPYSVRGVEYRLLDTAKGYKEEGIGSWYGLKFHGELTSNGEIYNMYSMSAAHKTLPLPSYLKVTNLENQESITVRVNDRGPFHDDRIIDLSYAAAKKLDYHKKGTARLLLESLIVPKDAGLDGPEGLGQAPAEDRLSYFVQVAALGNKDSASNLLKRLQKVNLGVDVFIGAAGADVYRVRLGPIDDRSVAVGIQQRLKSLGIGSPIVISRPVMARGS